MAETWLKLARDARRSASKLVRLEHYRSATSRAYYAAYSKVNHELTLSGIDVPPGREGFGHSRVRVVVVSTMPNMDKQARQALSRLLGRLYDLRIYADYSPSTIVDDVEAREAITLMNKVFDAF